SALEAGTISAASMIGALATMLVGGALADRVSRRASLIICPIIQAVALGTVAVLVQAHVTAITPLAAAALCSGLAGGIQYAVSIPALRRIVPRAQIGEATARGMGSYLGARLIGAPLSGLLFSITRWVPFLADAVSFVVIAVASALISKPLGPDSVEHTEKTSFMTDVRAGWRVVRRNSYLRLTIVWTALLNALMQGFILLFVALVLHRGGSASTVGIVNALGLAGGVLGSVASSALLRRLPAKRLLFSSLWILVIALAPVAFVPEPWQIGILLLVGMSMSVPLNAVLESYEVSMVPDDYSGRVAATTRFGSQALQWTGPLIAGTLSDRLGAPAAVAALTAVLAALTISLLFFRSALSVLDQPLGNVKEIEIPEERPAAKVLTTGQ
ncbi:MAG TPA: MFS transporter, partial [Pseudonocardiaceae bacterium]|nr:MFS transporter [Pseudonocardiaceae bacterium]